MLSAVEAASCVCFLRSVVRGVDAVDYNMPNPPGYRLIAPSQNRNRRFRHGKKHSLLPSGPPHAGSARTGPAPRNRASHAPECTSVRDRDSAATVDRPHSSSHIRRPVSPFSGPQHLMRFQAPKPRHAGAVHATSYDSATSKKTSALSGGRTSPAARKPLSGAVGAQQSMLSDAAKTVVSVSSIHENAIMRGGWHGVMVLGNTVVAHEATCIPPLFMPHAARVRTTVDDRKNK